MERERNTHDCAAALQRRYGLTGRQEEVARLMLARLTIPQMSKHTGLDRGTIKGHRIALYRRIDEKTPVGAVCKAYDAWIAAHLGDTTADLAQASCDRGGSAEEAREAAREQA